MTQGVVSPNGRAKEDYLVSGKEGRREESLAETKGLGRVTRSHDWP